MREEGRGNMLELFNLKAIKLRLYVLGRKKNDVF